MTFADFLNQAGLWQWIGLLILAGILAKGAAHFRMWGDIVKNKTKNIEKKP